MTESLTVARYFKYVCMTVTSNTSNVGEMSSVGNKKSFSKQKF